SRRLRAAEERLRELRLAQEGEHDEHAADEQQALQYPGSGLVDSDQHAERPAGREGAAEHLGADQDRRADDGDDARPGDGASCGGGGTHGGVSLLTPAMSPKTSARSRRKAIADAGFMSLWPSSQDDTQGRKSCYTRLQMREAP